MSRISRLQSGIAGVLLLAGSGVIAGSPALFIAALVPLTYAVYGTVSSVANPNDAIAVTRRCTPAAPLPGEQVTIELEITNQSTQTLPDVRIADGVPSPLQVTSGTAETGMTLRAGQTTTLSYTLQPTRGTYKFDETTVRLRSLAATAIETAHLTPDGTTEFACAFPTEEAPLRQKTIPFVGSVTTDSSGVGLEFHSTREYRHGDPVNQVNWRQYARTGELGTTLFREQEAANVVVIVDARPPEASQKAPGQPDGVTLATYAAVMSANAFLSENNNVGFAGLGVTGTIPGVRAGPPAYITPGMSTETRGRIGQLADQIATQYTGRNNRSDSDPDATESDARQSSQRQAELATGRLVPLLPTGAQVFYCTAALDDASIETGEKLRQHGYELTVLSPTITDGRTIGAQLESIKRTARLDQLRSTGASVIEWDPDQPLELALTRGTQVIQ